MERGCHGIVWEQEWRLATLPSGKTGKWEEEWLGLAFGGSVHIRAGRSSLHRAMPHAHVIRLLMPLSTDKGEAAAKSLEMKLGRLSQFLWD